MTIQKYQKRSSMRCEKCGELVHSMMAVPRRRKADGTIICFWQICYPCAKEVIEDELKRRNREMSKMRKPQHRTSRPTAKSVSVCRMRKVVRKIDQPAINKKPVGVKQENKHEKASKKTIKSKRTSIKISRKTGKKGSN